MRYSISAENLLWLLVGMAGQAHPQNLNEILEEAELIMPERDVIPTPDGMLRSDQTPDLFPPAKPE